MYGIEYLELPARAPWATAGSSYWMVMAYGSGASYPDGIAFVRDSTEAEGDWGELVVEFQYLVVIGPTRVGAATAVFRAVMDRWPNAWYTAATMEGEHFLHAVEGSPAPSSALPDGL